MCDNYNENLEKYKVLYKAYADEIRNLWQRSVFLGTFMVLVWTGYGALQLKFITRKCDEFDIVIYYCASIGLCGVIITLSLLWVAMAKGSKFVQEAHEEYIKTFIKDKLDLKILYCDLNNDEIVKNINANDSLVFFGTLKAFRYSPSKINIVLGWISFILSLMLLNIHLFMIDEIKRYIDSIISHIANSYYNEYVILIFILTYSLIFVALVTALIYLTLATPNQHKEAMECDK